MQGQIAENGLFAQPSLPSPSGNAKSDCTTDVAALGLGLAAWKSPPGGTRQRTSTFGPATWPENSLGFIIA
jgi:hypothetical protein